VAGEPLQCSVEVDGPLDLGLTLGPLSHGLGDPTTRVTASAVWRATRAGGQAATLHVWSSPGAGRTVVHAQAWGPGAADALSHLPALVGASDDASGFVPGHPLVHALHRRAVGLRVPASGAVVEALLPVILEQRVTGGEARRAYRGIVRRYGSPAPGPAGAAGLRLQPHPDVLAELGYAAFHPFGVERSRAECIRRVAANALRLDACADESLTAARQRLLAVPGIGEWTYAEVASVALGDADAVSVGDYHLPHTIAWALAGEPRGDDDRMLELLEPWRGHRTRVIRLIEGAGIHAPRRGPRMRLRHIQHQ
jgi:3-methyladenine DNA glycosylase/8-oxoguanine DNA glycosylase